MDPPPKRTASAVDTNWPARSNHSTWVMRLPPSAAPSTRKASIRRHRPSCRGRGPRARARTVEAEEISFLARLGFGGDIPCGGIEIDCRKTSFGHGVIDAKSGQQVGRKTEEYFHFIVVKFKRLNKLVGERCKVSPRSLDLAVARRLPGSFAFALDRFPASGVFP